jgi:hypothetical protein
MEKSQEFAPGYPADVVTGDATITLPVDIDRAALVPGARVIAFLDHAHTVLEVLRVEPLLVCRAPDGSEVTVYAHEVYTEAQGTAPGLADNRDRGYYVEDIEWETR